MFLCEYSQRTRTWAYTVHRVRAVAEHQAQSLLAQLTFVVFALATAYVALPYLPDDFAARLAFLSVGAIAAGGAAALGAVAYYGPFGVRLGLLLEKYPQSKAAIAAGYRMPAKPAFEEPGVVIGEAHSVREYSPDGDYVLHHRTDAAYSPVPEWAVLPAKSLVTGLLVLGSIGSGKTAYVLRPAVFQLFHHASRVGGLVMDSKAALVEPLRAEMNAAGRSADLLAVGPGQTTRWNPLHMPLSSPATVANALLTALENVNGAPFGADTRWIRAGAAHLAEGAVGLLRLLTDYVTASAVRALLSEILHLTAGSDTPGAVTKEYIDMLFAGSDAPAAQPEHFSYYAKLVIDRMGEDEKFRAIYVAELFNLLVPLTAPDVAHLYNAPEAALDMPDWAECINRGLVVVLDCNSRSVPGLAVILGMLLKLSYEDAMLARLAWVREGRCNANRYMALVIDEYQDYASPGDADYQALCRESKSMTVLLTQGFASIVQRVGEERAKVLLQSLRNRLVLNQTVPDFAADLLGQHDVTTVESNISENVTDASLAANGRFGGNSTVAQSYSTRKNREYVVAPEALSSLPLGQGILQSHDGSRPVPIHRVYLLPYYARAGARHADLEAA
ncbi:type IV secretion system DNA-binding domain-containing protein [Burkholderia pyrrocinia]|nr:type IV secretion system DNA-binding domain-containing protein [Burkholderia pyrrocinia]EKS9892806.1 type IV secretion system DNA-binding domain-containing protein [Burkholderia pyrrocinia]EKS9907681.1 type IV secretion system DNA-binding domain-containing protein [Burkholderia pyrrocinia]